MGHWRDWRGLTCGLLSGLVYGPSVGLAATDGVMSISVTGASRHHVSCVSLVLTQCPDKSCEHLTIIPLAMRHFEAGVPRDYDFYLNLDRVKKDHGCDKQSDCHLALFSCVYADPHALEHNAPCPPIAPSLKDLLPATAPSLHTVDKKTMKVDLDLMEKIGRERGLLKGARLS